MMERKTISALARQKETGTLPPASLGKTNSKRRFRRWHKRRNIRPNSIASLQSEDYRFLMNFSIEQTKKLPNLKNSQACNSGRNTAANANLSGAAGVRLKFLLAAEARKMVKP
ncbi:hypothetical protein [Endozoicomonas ascidiicola]|uniref:hypothetical protein n=1 Tax=Endozoicomonas ascidiicola TaxID=1698521 RepID=UPI00082E74D6|nr:hypothetical protein [Endozoicomonas ascidiicola]